MWPPGGVGDHTFGASGCGKSSLVRAGLLPALSGGLFAADGARWCVAELRPGDDPVGNLARSLVSSGVMVDEGGPGRSGRL